MGLARAKDICNRDWPIEFDRRLRRCERLCLRVGRRMERAARDVSRLRMFWIAAAKLVATKSALP